MPTCGRPGMCGMRPDCPDTHCPGREMARWNAARNSMLRLHQLEGGEHVERGIAQPIPTHRPWWRKAWDAVKNWKWGNPCL